ncbi:MAG: hypothetical protein RL410_464 [Actinomycetota bacterium]
MIRINNVNFSYDESPVLDDLSVYIPEGEFVLIAGSTGSGKSSLLHVINGLIPEFTGGTLSGEIDIDGETRTKVGHLRWSQLVATVSQSPQDSFVADTVEDEIAFGMETHGFAPDVMRQRMEEVLDLLNLATLRNRQLHTLSGGQQQRVAIAAAMTLNPKVLLLDEPTSALDPVAADEVLSTVHRLVHDLGLTVLIAEHRIERVMSYVDRVLLLDGSGHIQDFSPATAMRALPLMPVLTQLAELAGSNESPMTVRDTRRLIEPLRHALSEKRPPLRLIPGEQSSAVDVTNVSVVRDKNVILRNIDISIQRGAVTALMGRNGAGKSTLLHTMMGDFKPTAGKVVVDGHTPHELRGSRLLSVIGIVPQQPSDLLLSDRVADECRLADKARNAEAGTTRAVLALLAPTIDDDQHPRDLSEGQKLSLALSVVLAGQPDVILLDEPTRGLDALAKQQLIKFLRVAADRGQTIVLSTHDVELAAEIADDVIVLADGEVVARGNANDVLTASAMFSPLTARVLAPLPWLNVPDIRHAIANE